MVGLQENRWAEAGRQCMKKGPGWFTNQHLLKSRSHALFKTEKSMEKSGQGSSSTSTSTPELKSMQKAQIPDQQHL